MKHRAGEDPHTDALPAATIYEPLTPETLAAEWAAGTGELAPLPDGGEVVAVWTQSEWDRRQVRQLRQVEAAIDYLAASKHKPDSVLVRDALLMMGRPRAAAEHMAATSAVEDAHSIYASMFGPPPEAEAIEPARVIPPGRRRKPTARAAAKKTSQS